MEMPDTLLTEEEIWDILDPHNVTPPEARASMPLIDESNLVAEANAKAKRVMFELIDKSRVGHTENNGKYNMVFVMSIEAYQALRKWALGEE